MRLLLTRSLPSPEGLLCIIGSRSTTVRKPIIRKTLPFKRHNYSHSIAGAIIFTVIALLSVFSYFGFKGHIKFSSLLLQVVMDISKHHTSVFLVAFIALILQAGLSVYVGDKLLLSPSLTD